MTEDLNGRILIAKAIIKARDAYEKVFEKGGIDSAYYPMNIVVYMVEEDFDRVVFSVEDREWLGEQKRRDEITDGH